MPDVIGIGSSVYDTLILLEEYPAEDTKTAALETLVQGGGPCATALVAMAKLGVSTAFMGAVGEDPFGRFMLEDLEKYGVSTAHVRRVPDAISFHAVVLLSRAAGTRTCVWSRGTVPPPAPEELDEAVLRGAKALHLDGHMTEAAIHAAKIVRASGGKVCYDAGSIYPGVEALLPLTDFLIPSEEYALKVTGAQTPEEAARRLYDEYRPEIVVLTQGAQGGILCRDGRLSRYPAFTVDVVDSNGAGDTFHGAFVAAFLQGMEYESCAIYASAVSALKCTHLGAREGIPNDAQVRAFLAERKVSL